MEDWLGETTFEVDLLHQLTVVTDHKGNQVEYTYDSMDRIREMRYYSGDGVLYMTHWVIWPVRRALATTILTIA